ncbi:MAG TPA: 4Fe-4S cluster-binding domain-containing protein [Chloroflexota bacterium]|nr:4Fe-4S cluster-binding domain-containing protein [Chloroflexota bacterium]
MTLEITCCHVPETHDPAAGVELPVADVVAAALDPSGAPRDGITISGGEPFYQPAGLLALVRGLRARGCRHVLCYSGYTLAALRARSTREPAIAEVLDAIDTLIDGPYVVAAAGTAGRWTGSGNQRVLGPTAMRRGRLADRGRGG